MSDGHQGDIMINFGSLCRVREGSSHRKSTGIVTVNRLPIGHESKYNYLDLTPKMTLMWRDKIILVIT